MNDCFLLLLSTTLLCQHFVVPYRLGKGEVLKTTVSYIGYRDFEAFLENEAHNHLLGYVLEDVHGSESENLGYRRRYF